MLSPAVDLLLQQIAEDPSSNMLRQVLHNFAIQDYYHFFTKIEKQPWGMLDFVLKDPTGVLWRFGQNQK